MATPHTHTGLNTELQNGPGGNKSGKFYLKENNLGLSKSYIPHCLFEV
ncbi:hypothetical protein DBT_0704 [Dissulfuribacter thermophilus]|uniref:Uncharacterized protein n=1 Tax=Dissulfuribacter thermophilus TaxID=1156395 RepID=A0A1B9F756_9BACT|nr:hypothetical protein DBT_0704 [Dissulfuribacter thermophilus]